jgi:hypothetical protein
MLLILSSMTVPLNVYYINTKSYINGARGRHYATSRKVAVSITDEVIGFFN